jgi:GNAT superfamily N-acetyltransferase
MVEITSDVWDGHDYLPSVFDAWVTDPGATFQAAEVEGEVAGFQRLRPLSREIIQYEGLRVGARFRRQGLARRMLTAAVAQARGMGFKKMRLASGNPDAIRLFTSAGFELELGTDIGVAGAAEGGEPPALGRPEDVERLFRTISADPAFAVYKGLVVDGEKVRELDEAELARQAELGRLRTGGGGRVLAVVRPWGGDETLWIGYLSGSGAALTDLLLALRSEADLVGRTGVGVFLPDGHPARGELEESGYDFGTRPERMGYYALRLQN